MRNKYYILLVLFFVGLSSFSQDDKKENDTKEDQYNVIKLDSTYQKREAIDPLSPSKAAFYSAILPGLGQAYNKKYWKVPIVIGGIVGSILVYDFNNKEYNRYRNAFKSRLAGFETDEFYTIINGVATPTVTTDGLIRAQETLKRSRDLWLLITIGIYVLNIVDANVDAHLLQFNVDDNLSLKPHYKFDEFEKTSNFGLTLNFGF